MSIVNSIATFTNQGCQLVQVNTTAFLVAGLTIRIPAGSVNFSPAVARGYWRVKIYNQTVAISLTSVNVQASDGTNTITVDDFVPVAAVAITATAWVDVCGDFILDTSTAGGGATGTLIFGGATLINIILAGTGAGGTATADAEVAAEP
jgi:hypothetical protein